MGYATAMMVALAAVVFGATLAFARIRRAVRW